MKDALFKPFNFYDYDLFVGGSKIGQIHMIATGIRAKYELLPHGWRIMPIKKGAYEVLDKEDNRRAKLWSQSFSFGNRIEYKDMNDELLAVMIAILQFVGYESRDRDSRYISGG